MSSSRRGRSLAEVMSPIEEDAQGEFLEATTAAAQPMEPRASPAERHVPTAEVTVGPGGQQVVPVNILVAPEDRRRLRQLSLDANLSLQKLGHEAWNLLLQKRGLPPLKPVSANVPSGRSRA